MVLFSDLLGDPPSTMHGLRLLRQRGHDVMVLHILDDDELDFPIRRPDAVRGPGAAPPPEVQSPSLARGLPASPGSIPIDRAARLCKRRY